MGRKSSSRVQVERMQCLRVRDVLASVRIANCPADTVLLDVVRWGRLSLVSRHQHYGGLLWSFCCPWCERACRVLYRGNLNGGSAAVACRRCHNLRYRSQSLSLAARWEWRATKIVARLGGEAYDGLLYKPRGMHTATFNRLVEEVQLNNAAAGYRIRGIFGLP
ncbi:MAG: hypothetical protein JWM95_228 [Gemmatimonadetes bacterium]|nr:hypothetical protein [Gemmatimonadota bacterium]